MAPFFGCLTGIEGFLRQAPREQRRGGRRSRTPDVEAGAGSWRQNPSLCMGIRVWYRDAGTDEAPPLVQASVGTATSAGRISLRWRGGSLRSSGLRKVKVC